MPGACCSKALPGFIHPEAHLKVLTAMVFWGPNHIKLLFEDKLPGAHDTFSELPSCQVGAAITCLTATFATFPATRLCELGQLFLWVLFIGGPRLRW